MAGNDSKEAPRDVKSQDDTEPQFIVAGIEYRCREKWQLYLGIKETTFFKWQAWGATQTPCILQANRGATKKPLYGGDEIAQALRAPTKDIDDVWNQKKLLKRKKE